MSGKAKTRKTFGSKLKDQQNNNKTFYNLANQGTIMSAGNSVIGGGSSGSSSSLFQVAEADLDMNTYDITNLDRLKFGAKEGTGDLLTNTDYGIEALYVGGDAYGMWFRIPATDANSNVTQYQWKRGDDTVMSIGTTEMMIDFPLSLENYVDIFNISSPSNPPANYRRLFVDSGNSDHLSVKDSSGNVVDLEGATGANTDLSNLTATGESKFVKAADDVTWTGDHIFDTTAAGSTTTSPVKFQGDGGSSAQRVLEIGEYGNHSVKFIAELEGDVGREMSNPDGGADIPVPPTSGGVSIEPTLSIKSAIVMNTYTMYDLDTLVFSQSGSSTTPPPEDDWVYIEANTGTSGSPNLTGMTYNVPTSKTHQFKVNGSLKISIDDNIEFETGSTLNFKEFGNPSSWTSGGGTALPSNPTAYFKVKYNGADRYIPYYTAS